MAMQSFCYILTFFILSASAVFHVSSISDAPSALPHIPSIIIFGDSIVDTGNNNKLLTVAKCNFPPYGKDFPGSIPTGRFTNGKTPADFIAQKLGIKDSVPAYLDPNLKDEDLKTGVSFASGGTGYDDQTARFAGVISLSRQLEMFKEYIGRLKVVAGEEETNRILRESLYFVAAVSNDLANTYFNNVFRRFQYTVDQYADFLTTSASNFLQDIYKLGARKMAVYGAPPIGCLPLQRTIAGGLCRNCSDKQNRAAELYNIKLSSRLNSLNATLPQSKVIYVDIYNPLHDIIENPSKYGLDVVDKGCCSGDTLDLTVFCNVLTPTCQNASKYLFWDGFHPTEQGYKLIVERAFSENMHKFFI